MSWSKLRASHLNLPMLKDTDLVGNNYSFVYFKCKWWGRKPFISPWKYCCPVSVYKLLLSKINVANDVFSGSWRQCYTVTVNSKELISFDNRPLPCGSSEEGWQGIYMFYCDIHVKFTARWLPPGNTRTSIMTGIYISGCDLADHPRVNSNFNVWGIEQVLLFLMCWVILRIP